METNIYVVGFNLYYGALTGGPCKWLDLGRFFAAVPPAAPIIKPPDW